MDLLKFIVEFLWLIEATPTWWFDHGLTLPLVLVVTLATYLIKLALDVTVTHFVFALLLKLYRAFSRFIGLPPGKIRWWERFWSKVDVEREALIRRFHRLGHAGLFIVGLVPGLSMLGPVLYNLDPLNKPWYRFHNLAFFWLYLGGAVRMAASVWACYKLL